MVISTTCTNQDRMSEVLATIEKIQVACFKHGVRTHEFFIDHDKLRQGLCTEDEFKSGISLLAQKIVMLSKKEVQELAEFYKVPDDGRVYYKSFCDLIENTFHVSEMEKKPRTTIDRPPQGMLARSMNPLLQEDEARLQEILKELYVRVHERRLPVFAFFKDYDRGVGFTGNVTKNQFARILHVLGLNVNPEDFRILVKKFEEQTKGDISYPAFCQAIDYQFVASKIEDPKPDAFEDPKLFSELPLDTSNVNLEELMGRIREFCMINSIRLRETFQDFDPLRSYSITNNQFRRALVNRGIQLSNQEFEVLNRTFADPKRVGNSLWKDFSDTVDCVFTQVLPNMERTPLQKPHEREVFYMPEKGGMDWATATTEHRIMVDECMRRFRQNILQRRLLVKPTFESFDKLNHRYVTRAQFKQCLTMLNLAATEKEMAAVEAKFSNDKGFNYWRFLTELEPHDPPEHKYKERMETLKLVNTARAKMELEYESSFDRLMIKLKNQMSKKPIRVVEFMKDFDTYHHDKILKENFYRSLDVCGFKLEAPEKELLYTNYKSKSEEGQVNYKQFCYDLESVFTVHELEKSPQTEPTQGQIEYHMQPAHVTNQLSPEAERTLQACLHQLAKRVLPTRMQLFPPFRDFDKHNRGAVTKEQFRRVLTEQLGLGSLLSEVDYSVIFAKYQVEIGGKTMIEYTPICHEIYRLAHIDYEKP